MIKTCKKCSIKFEITSSDLDFYKKISPKFDGKIYEIPTPTLCPDCRQQRRLSFRNERKLYKRDCDATGKSIISMFSDDKEYIVYEADKWFLPENDFISCGTDIDFNKTFFEQMSLLSIKVPKRNIIIGGGSENCDYVNGVGGSKNCYIIFNTSGAENCYYGNSLNKSINCIDCSFVQNSENCYGSIDCNKCFNIFYGKNLENCSNSSFLSNCNGCSNCFGCFNLTNKKYYIFNKEYSKELYYIEIERLNKKYLLEDFLKFSKDMIVKNNSNLGVENVSGDKIKNSSNIYNSFEIDDSSNISNCTMIINNSHYCFDVDGVGNNISNIYESIVINKNCNSVFFSYDCWNNCNNVFYSIGCKISSNLFFCEGLLNKSYCILNKQYTKEEYEKLVPQIIEKMQENGEWGEFFPSSLSPFGYNETVAQEYFPLEKEEIIKQNFNYSEYENPKPNVDKIIPANRLPGNIGDIPDDILNWAIKCEVSGKSFRIIKQELDFYRKHNLPIPRKHPDVRHFERMKLRNPRKLFDRNCDKCEIDIKTTYSPNREEIVICEKCYEKEIY